MYVAYASTAGDRRIHVVTLDPANGKITPIQVVEVPGPNVAESLSMPLGLSPDHRHLYAAIRVAPYLGSVFSIDRHTGRLTLAGSAELPDEMCYIRVDASRRFLIGASFIGSTVSVTPIASDARIAPPATAFFPLRRAHCVVPSPDGRFHYIVSHGTDTIGQYALDRTSGRLVSVAPPYACAKGAGPRHLEIHAATSRMYVANEQNGSVDMLRIEPQSGSLSHIATATMLPAGYDAVSTAADIHITRNGRFLYASERTRSFLVSYAVDAERGKLDVIEWVDTEESPRSFAIDPSDRFLLCTGQTSGGLSAYAIDQARGRLHKTDSVSLGPNANWIDVIELP